MSNRHAEAVAAANLARAPRYEVRGALVTMAELAAMSGLKGSTIRDRMRARGVSAEVAAFGPAPPVGGSRGESLHGLRFGRMTVLAEAKQTDDRKRRFLCRCDCGTTKEALGAHLKNGSVVWCGCAAAEGARARSIGRREDLTGKTFGAIVVIRQDGFDLKSKSSGAATRVAIWECRCRCGKLFKAKASQLRSGEASGCGCVRLKRMGRAKARKVEFHGVEVTLRDLEDITGVSVVAMRQRIDKGIAPEDAAARPYRRRDEAPF